MTSFQYRYYVTEKRHQTYVTRFFHFRRLPIKISGYASGADTFILFTWSKQKWLFWRAGFYPANQSNLNIILKALIGWKKLAL